MSPIMESSDFTIRRKDFPALPGNASTPDSSSDSSWSEDSSDENTGPSHSQQDKDKENPGINVSPDGKVSNIPCSMIKDQFGIVGLLTFIKATETEPNLMSLSIGEDLTTFGLNLKSTDNLYSNFGGPWTESGSTPEVPDLRVPQEYLMNPIVRKKLAKVVFSKYKDDLLFYLFYTQTRDVIQIAAAAELYKRGWRYHTEDRVWMSAVPGGVLLEKMKTQKWGSYYVFDHMTWKKSVKECFLDCDKLENQPIFPESLHIS